MGVNHILFSFYATLNAHFGNLSWWPADSPFEVIVGAILTQNTSWKNVERAICRLKEAGMLSLEVLVEASDEVLYPLIKPVGYYRIKTERLKAFTQFVREQYGGFLERMFAEDTDALREKLLNVKGIGEETADSILLYAAEKPVFVVDAYTRRILTRHGVIRGDESYRDVQKLFMNSLPPSVPLFNQYHALLVNTGKHFCRRIPRCGECPLGNTFPKKEVQENRSPHPCGFA